MRMLGTGQRDHGKTMRKRSEVLLEFVRRPAGGNEMDFVEIETAVGGSRNRKMAVVYGIERAAKERDTARMMFSGGAVRLRGGQCVSQKDITSPDKTGDVDSKNNFLMNS